MTVTPEEYMPKTVEHCQFSNRFLATVVETGQTWVAEDDFVLEKPNLSIRIIPEGHVLSEEVMCLDLLSGTKCIFS